MPVLSIIIPTLNRGRVFQDTVAQVLRQRLADFELIVVDQSDEPVRGQNEAFLHALGDDRVSYLFVPTKNLPNARNEGLARVGGAVVLFLDDDVILLGDDFLDAHVDAFRDPAVGGVTGRTIERSMASNSAGTAMHVTPGGRTIINLTGTTRCAVAGLKGANMSYRGSLFAELGGFDRNFVGSAILEDVDFSFRVTAAGRKLVFEPKAEMLHLSAPSGGVRVVDAIARECWRFQLTCYFVLKHRGIVGLLPFALTFGLIGAVRVLRWRQPKAALALWQACERGWQAWKRGPDQRLAVSRLAEGPGNAAPSAAQVGTARA